MSEKKISDIEAMSIINLFMIGTASVIVPGIAVAKRDMWLAVIFAVSGALLVALMCARLQYILPSKNLFDIFEFCFGKFIGKFMTFIYFLFFFHSGTLVSMDVTEFIKIVAFENTPYVVLIGFLVFLGIYVIREGTVILGRWSKIFARFITILIIITSFFLIPEMNIDNLTPVLYDGIKPVIGGAFVLYAFPLTQLAPFIAMFDNFKTQKSPFNVYIKGILIAGVTLFVVALANMLVLGPGTASTLYFPSHDTIKRIHFGEGFQRVEIIADGTFVLGGFVMFSTYLTAASKALARTFGYMDYKFIALPVGLLMIDFTRFLNEGYIDHLMFVKTWPTYSFPFLTIIPLILWIIAEIKTRKQGNTV